MLVITIITLRSLTTLVYSIYDSTQVAIKKIIKASQKMINEQLNSPPVNEHFKLQIKTLQNAPRDTDKLEQLLKAKESAKDEAMHIEDTQGLFAEIQMIKVVLCLGHMNRVRNE
jgi:Na+-translocating ferredoxin:NAD+ oxidoreductase RnfG subunit